MTWPTPAQINAPARAGEIVGWRATSDALASPPVRESWRVVGAGRCHAVTASIVASWIDDPRVAAVYAGPRKGRADAIPWRVSGTAFGDLAGADRREIAARVRWAIGVSLLGGRQGPIYARPSRHDAQIARELLQAWGALVARLDARDRAPESAALAIDRSESRRAARAQVDSAPHKVESADRRHIDHANHGDARSTGGTWRSPRVTTIVGEARIDRSRVTPDWIGRSVIGSTWVGVGSVAPWVVARETRYETTRERYQRPHDRRRESDGATIVDAPALVDSAPPRPKCIDRLSMAAVRARSVARRAAATMHGFNGATVDLGALVARSARPGAPPAPTLESESEARARRDLDRARRVASRMTSAALARSALTVAAWPARVAPRLVSTIAANHGPIVASLWYHDVFSHRVKRAGDRDSARIPSNPDTLH